MSEIPEWATPPSTRNYVNNWMSNHEASHCCSKFLTVTLIAVSIIGVLSGVFAYLVSSGYLFPSTEVLTNLGNMGTYNSYVLMGVSATAFLFLSILLACHHEPSHE